MCPMSLHSVTAHGWTQIQHLLLSSVLQANKFHGSHTDASIAKTTEEMLSKWNIPKPNVHVVLRD